MFGRFLAFRRLIMPASLITVAIVGIIGFGRAASGKPEPIVAVTSSPDHPSEAATPSNYENNVFAKPLS